MALIRITLEHYAIKFGKFVVECTKEDWNRFIDLADAAKHVNQLSDAIYQVFGTDNRPLYDALWIAHGAGMLKKIE